MFGLPKANCFARCPYIGEVMAVSIHVITLQLPILPSSATAAQFEKVESDEWSDESLSRNYDLRCK